MKKNFFALFFAVFALSACSSDDSASFQRVEKSNLSAVEQAALSFVGSIDGSLSSRGNVVSTLSVKSIKQVDSKSTLTRGAQNDSTAYSLYMVSLNENKGLVLVAEKKGLVNPIGYFPKENGLEPNNIVKIDTTTHEFNGIVKIGKDEYENSSTADQETLDFNWRQYEKIDKKIKPKCKVFWYQRPPYNRYCFTKDGVSAKAGCVAIAGAQALTVLRPQTDMISSWDEAVKDFPSEQVIDEIAHFVSFIGKTINTCYGTEYSSADPDGLIPLFSRYGIKDYGEKNLFRALDSPHGVIVVSAYQKNKSQEYVGHAFIADGYIKYRRSIHSCYLHINYGWGEFDQPKYKDAYILCSDKTWEPPMNANDEIFPYFVKFYSFAYPEEMK